ncbi:CoxG family protein [Bordetella petrii]|uniref:SRPBCC domain-containing protein n=1 Tax=Bordetella petrii TaxID=94624 RepID=A0ABT7VYR9_9BORD|nr:SRPBCC domain-containing protein [Bordetella petrii]MDM9558073.1 SRPBCC domain-containing protein [Bordetella petrii]
MDFRIDALLPATAAQLWAIFFDVKRVATLIPGCENVVEVEKLKEFSAVMRQKIGPFKLEVPTRIEIDAYDTERQVSLKAAGSDKATGTTIDVGMVVNLDEQRDGERVLCKLDVSATMQVAGRLASLGYPIVRKRSEQLFAEFEQRLRAELSHLDGTKPALAEAAPPEQEEQAATMPRISETRVPAGAPQPAVPAARSPRHDPPAIGPSDSGGTELVLLWPRLGINVAVAVGVAHGAVAFGQSPWWWLAAPLLGVAASLGKRGA